VQPAVLGVMGIGTPLLSSPSVCRGLFFLFDLFALFVCYRHSRFVNGVSFPLCTTKVVVYLYFAHSVLPCSSDLYSLSVWLDLFSVWDWAGIACSVLCGFRLFALFERRSGLWLI